MSEITGDDAKDYYDRNITWGGHSYPIQFTDSSPFHEISLYGGGWTYSTRQWIGMKLRAFIDKILFWVFDL